MRALPSFTVVLVGSIALGALGGCSKKKDRETATDDPNLAPPIAKTTLEPVAEAPPLAPDAAATATIIPLGCDKVFPQALRDKYFKGAKSVDGGGSGYSGSCTLTLADKSTLNLTAMCWDTVPPGMLETTFDKLAALSVTAPTVVPGVGKDTRFTPTSPTRNTLVAWDGDAPCSVSADLPKSVDVPAFARDALATFPAK